MPRTPSSLKWLINKHARISNAIKKAEEKNSKKFELEVKRIELATQELKNAEDDLTYKRLIAPQLLDQLRTELFAIEVALGLHEIQIKPDSIPAINSYSKNFDIKWGAVTKDIFQCLKLAGGAPVSTPYIVEFISSKHGLALDHSQANKLRIAIVGRLKALCKAGKVNRHHELKTSKFGRWSI